MVEKRQQSITDAEMAVLRVLWECGDSTVKEIAGAIYGDASTAEVGATEIGTVHTLIKRLEQKGLTTRDRDWLPHRISALVTQSDVAGQELQAIAERVSDGSLAPFLTHLIGKKRLRKKDLAELRKLLEKHKS